MTQEDKDLLFKDLCGRLPYGVKVEIYNHWRDDYEDETLTLENYSKLINTFSVGDIKPYLFPMSSMTKEQEEELKNMYYSLVNGMFYYTERIFDGIPFSKMKYFPYQIEGFFNKNHIDYRGLIPKGLAKDATGLNIY